ncbi:MAG: crotonase [Deltaproteobacteria bacterium]|nr:MAG: crotonase [Deltaproteobacteria bacterium]
MSYENVKFEREGRVALVTVNRPKALNALNDKTFDELDAIFEEIAGDDSIGSVVLTGAGEKAFVAGADITELAAAKNRAEGEAISLKGQGVMAKIQKLKKPVIVAINGFALGGGLELAMSGHVRFASETAKMGLPEITLGLLPGYAGTQRLPRLVGSGMANLMAMTGEMIDAAEAYRIGLVEKVFPADTLLDEAKTLASKLAKKSAVALGLMRAAIEEGLETTLEAGSKIEAGYFGDAFESEDMREGTGAFLEKRKAEFKHR